MPKEGFFFLSVSQQNDNSVVFSLLCIPFLSDYKSQPVHQSLMFPVALHDIDSRRVDARMPQQIGQLRDVPVEAVEGSGKQMPEIVGKDFFCLHSRGAAQAFHLRPDIGTVHFSSRRPVPRRYPSPGSIRAAPGRAFPSEGRPAVFPCIPPPPGAFSGTAP